MTIREKLGDNGADTRRHALARHLDVALDRSYALAAVVGGRLVWTAFVPGTGEDLYHSVPLSVLDGLP